MHVEVEYQPLRNDTVNEPYQERSQQSDLPQQIHVEEDLGYGTPDPKYQEKVQQIHEDQVRKEAERMMETAKHMKDFDTQ